LAKGEFAASFASFSEAKGRSGSGSGQNQRTGRLAPCRYAERTERNDRKIFMSAIFLSVSSSGANGSDLNGDLVDLSFGIRAEFLRLVFDM
jgi:hypothetical protein